MTQTEWGPLSLVDENVPDLPISLLLARTISEHINFLGVEAWSHWQAVTMCWAAPCNQTEREQWGLVRLEWTIDPSKPLFFSKQYYVTMQFSRWIRPGTRVYRVDDTYWGRYTCLAVDEVKGRFIAVLTNPREYPMERVVTPPDGFCPQISPGGQKPSVVRWVYQTTAADNFRLVHSGVRSGCPENVSVVVEPMSVTTVILELGGNKK